MEERLQYSATAWVIKSRELKGYFFMAWKISDRGPEVVWTASLGEARIFNSIPKAKKFLPQISSGYITQITITA